MIRRFYKYAKNWYLGENFNNFVYKKLIWIQMVFICSSISIKIECYIFLFIENTKWERWIPISIFSIKSFTLFLFKFLTQIHDTNNLLKKLLNKLWHIFLYLVNIILEILEMVLVDSIFVIKNNLLLLTWYGHQSFGVVVGE